MFIPRDMVYLLNSGLLAAAMSIYLKIIYDVLLAAARST